MADSGIKKVVILKKDLPDYLGTNESLFYKIRYRLISEDKNRTSSWSPIYEVGDTSTQIELGFNPNTIPATFLHNISINTATKVISLNWTMPALQIPNPTVAQKILQIKQAQVKNFDIYIRWKTGSTYSGWQWQGTSTSPSFTTSYTTSIGGPTKMQIAVTKVTQNKERFDSATYFITQDQTL